MNLTSYSTSVDAYDPCANKEDLKKELNIELIDSLILSNYQAIILCVA